MALKISGISKLPSQEFQFLIEEGTITIRLHYKSAIEMWMLDVIFEDKSFFAYSIRVCSHPNLLGQFANLIPFGLQVVINTDAGYEPITMDDFSSERVSLLILSPAEVIQVEDAYKTAKEI